MSDNVFYSDIIISKSGIEIPVFNNGKTVDSRYDPQRESIRLSDQIKDKTNFVIVLGIASGILIKSILEKRENIFILAVESEQADINFLMKLENIKQISNNKRVCLCTINQLFEKITQLYIPAFYGNLEVIEQRGWTTEHNSKIPQINEQIQKAVGIVSADFSVQSHFGKLWQHNILSNVKIIHKSKHINCAEIPVNKTAVIFAAGPSIDNSILQIKKNLDDFYLIASDTALSILLSYNIIPDVVVSIDGQNVSNSHFIHSKQFDFSKTIFLFDLCANDSAAKKIISQNGILSFFVSGHPLGDYINQKFSLFLPKLFSGAGTVTISAVDFAIQAGFKNIIVSGADFAYSNGKPYAKGTYLDRIYNKNSERLNNSQNQFCKLMYRTPLIQKSAFLFTTQILDAYKTSFEDYLNSKSLIFSKENELYKITNQNNLNTLAQSQKMETMPDGEILIEQLYKDFLSQDINKNINSIFDLTNIDICLLPLISWQKNNDNIDNRDFMYFYRKALGGIKK